MIKPYYLLDTSVIAEPVRENPNPKIIARIEKYVNVGAISAPTLYELYHGLDFVKDESRRDKLYKYITSVVRGLFSVIPYDDFSASVQADFRLRDKSKKVSARDLVQAAVSKSNNMILATKEPGRYSNIIGLTVEDWSE